MNKIGIIGQGYVGEAVKVIFEKYYTVDTFDINKKSTCLTLEELVKKTDYIFICLPTPMNKDGSCNTQIVKTTIKNINKISNNDKIVVIKSTIPPTTSKSFAKEYKNISIIFNPEFLTESNYIKDFENQNRIIIGGDDDECRIIEKIYKPLFPKAKIIITDSTTAEMIKYLTNTFLATKVSFANEIKLLCNKINIDYNLLIEHSLLDGRLGDSHWSVPGPDGKKGFGGSCFPKDINALISFAKSLKVDLNILKAVWETNLNMRPEKDWERLKGRAVSE